jgi:hypothetical protein
LEEPVKKKRTKGNSWTVKGGGFFNTSRRDIQDITFGHRTTNWINGAGDHNYKAKHTYKITSFYVDWDYNIVVRETNVYKDIEYYHFIFIILQGFRGQNPKYKGGNVKGVNWICDSGWTR